jgi:hypothetical protein
MKKVLALTVDILFMPLRLICMPFVMFHQGVVWRVDAWVKRWWNS